MLADSSYFSTFSSSILSVISDSITGPPNGPVLFCTVVCRRRLLSFVTLPACGPAGCQARGLSARWWPGAWTVGQPTLHCGPVRLWLCLVNLSLVVCVCRLLTGLKITDLMSAYKVMQQLLETGVKTVVISSTQLSDENTLLALASTVTGSRSMS